MNPVRIQRKRTTKDRKKWLNSSSRPRATCHTDKPHRANGMCDRCYNKWLYANSDRHRKTKIINNTRWRKANPARVKASQRAQKLKKKYGLTPAQYEAMRKAQKGRCAICNKKNNSLHVDHNHTTGRVRKLLCIRCNGSLAWVEMILENNAWFLAAKKYLEITNA